MKSEKAEGDNICGVLDSIVRLVGKYVPESEKGAVEEILGKIEKIEKNKITISKFENELKKAVKQIGVDSMGGDSFIPDLKDILKVNIGLQDGEFNVYARNLSEAGKCKMSEGSGDRGVNHHGRNLMFLRMLKR